MFQRKFYTNELACKTSNNYLVQDNYFTDTQQGLIFSAESESYKKPDMILPVKSQTDILAYVIACILASKFTQVSSYKLLS